MNDELERLRGRAVLVAGAGVSGRATIEPLTDLGAHVTVTDRNERALAEWRGARARTDRPRQPRRRPLLRCEEFGPGGHESRIPAR
ncbi:hypothetical protein NJ76_01545, partial [Rhodococcus sp. IITR03]